MAESGMNPTSKEAPPVCHYSDFHFLYTTTSSHEQGGNSCFDQSLLSQWEAARIAGLFNYEVNTVETKILPGKYGIVAQLNVNRLKMRRAPEPIMNVVQPCDPTKFNFTKISANEVLAELCYSKSDVLAFASTSNCKENTKYESDIIKGSLIINTAPICPSHSLLVPNINELTPQILDKEGLILAVHSTLLSSTPDYRIGFNSLAGFASVNHLHFHIYYLPYKLFLETAKCTRLAGPCFVFCDYHSPGFVFELENHNVADFVCSVMKVVELLLEERIAHNIFITRGTPLQDSSPSDEYTTIRLIIWGRKCSNEMKDVSLFAAAVCELAGHVPVYSIDRWNGLTEDDITPTLEKTCKETYLYLLPRVEKLFIKNPKILQ